MSRDIAGRVFSSLVVTRIAWAARLTGGASSYGARMNSCLVEFENEFLAIMSRNAVRRPALGWGNSSNSYSALQTPTAPHHFNAGISGVLGIDMVKRSAGLLMYRRQLDEVEVFLVHPGGPYWAKKDQGAWTIPKGEYDDNEEPFAAAKREFFEETGFTAKGEFLSLGEVRQKSGKLVSAWAFEGDCDPLQLQSNTCEIEWPPKSGKHLQIPEINRGRWFNMNDAHLYIRPELDELLLHLHSLIRNDHDSKADR